ncbi:hypothetical protein PUR71_00005 [Streptomyces sp. SP17BM10]|nr:hypothetical protein [Streptomyces sp. SP17BM10]MEE1781347.1 hypothetical protein [Streptomyces sp. SP17BM10]
MGGGWGVFFLCFCWVFVGWGVVGGGGLCARTSTPWAGFFSPWWC